MTPWRLPPAPRGRSVFLDGSAPAHGGHDAGAGDAADPVAREDVEVAVAPGHVGREPQQRLGGRPAVAGVRPIWERAGLAGEVGDRPVPVYAADAVVELAGD